MSISLRSDNLNFGHTSKIYVAPFTVNGEQLGDMNIKNQIGTADDPVIMSVNAGVLNFDIRAVQIRMELECSSKPCLTKTHFGSKDNTLPNGFSFSYVLDGVEYRICPPIMTAEIGTIKSNKGLDIFFDCSINAYKNGWGTFGIDECWITAILDFRSRYQIPRHLSADTNDKIILKIRDDMRDVGIESGYCWLYFWEEE